MKRKVFFDVNPRLSEKSTAGNAEPFCYRSDNLRKREPNFYLLTQILLLSKGFDEISIIKDACVSRTQETTSRADSWVTNQIVTPSLSDTIPDNNTIPATRFSDPLSEKTEDGVHILPPRL
jgi:hypothetical protein